MKTYDQVLLNMEATLHHLVAQVLPPQLVERGSAVAYRYRERTIHQAIVQKLARVVSGLHAASLLMHHGFFQEQGALQRIIDELNEDLWFLALGVIYDDISELHIDYLNAFYEEEFDKPDDALGSSQRRPMIKRQKIRAYLARIDNDADPSSRTELLRTVSKTYSGFVHAASPHIMDMYGGVPPHFHVAGMLGTPHAQSHESDLWNSFYRGIGSFALAAKALSAEELFVKVLGYMREFAADGLGNTAHVFDALAPKLAARYRVLGVTRRGFGASSAPASGYGADRLGDDVLAVMQQLSIDKPVLVGHSFGGEELSSIGSRHPESVAGLVYLEAGYSYAFYAPGIEPIPAPPPPEAPMPPVIRAIMDGMQKYTSLPVPILAVYAIPQDPSSTADAARRAANDAENRKGEAQAQAFAAALPTARVVRIPHGNHYVFTSNEADVTRELDAFIARLK